MQIILRLVKKNWFLKTMHHLSIVFQKLTVQKIDNAEDLDVVMRMYNLLEYSKNYKKTTVTLWNYYRDEPNSSTDDDNNITHSILNSEYF